MSTEKAAGWKCETLKPNVPMDRGPHPLALESDAGAGLVTLAKPSTFCVGAGIRPSSQPSDTYEARDGLVLVLMIGTSMRSRATTTPSFTT